MPISKRTLTKWREDVKDIPEANPTLNMLEILLLLTQELLDQQLLKEK